jgi:OOP family OmpA-OmpF porin
MLRKVFLIFLLVSFFGGKGIAQTEKLSSTVPRAVLMYQRSLQLAKDREFEKAIVQMQDAIRRDPKFGEAYLRLAGYYTTLANKGKAYENYKKGISLLSFNPGLANDYITVADAAMDYGDYQLAEEQFNNFIKASTEAAPKFLKKVPYAEFQIKSCQFAQKAIQNPVNFEPKRMQSNINQFAMQYFPTVTADQRYFLYTARGDGPEADENLFIASLIKDRWSDPASVSAMINTTDNEGASTISGDGKTLVFTSCNRPDSHGDCDLYISYRKGDQWSKPKNMGPVVNSATWDSQPSLSADGRTLYFTSLRKNGVGQEDIWTSHLLENGTWSPALNLGAPINTAGKDMGPFIHASNSTLYFVSDGHIGMGGLDVYEANIENNGWGQPKNMGYPLNTYQNEGSVFITSNNSKGYYSRQLTNPNSGKRSIEIYEFDVPAVWRSKETSTYAQGRVFDAVTKKPIQAEVQLYDLAIDELTQQVSSDQVNGEYTIVLNEGSHYAMYASAEGYLLKSLSFDYTSRKDFNPLTLDIYLDPVKSGSSVVLNNLFFESGKYSLQPQSKTELKKLIAFMKRNSSIRVEISGHTDDVGSDPVNQQLSEKRAQSVATYLGANGISKERIKAIGYGKNKPAMPNNSEANRQQNRRIEFRIL